VEHNIEYLAGIVLQTVVLMLGAYGFVLRAKWSNDDLKEKVDSMQAELKKLSEVIIAQAVQTTRLDNLVSQFTLLVKTVESLRRGSGFIRGDRPSVDGEYDG
jgi:hypothetical protein